MDPGRFLRNTVPDASVHSGPILKEDHYQYPTTLEELKALHSDCLQKKKAFLVSLEKWRKLKDSIDCLSSPALTGD
jgi:hypothetical protein